MVQHFTMPSQPSYILKSLLFWLVAHDGWLIAEGRHSSLLLFRIRTLHEGWDRWEWDFLTSLLVPTRQTVCPNNSPAAPSYSEERSRQLRESPSKDDGFKWSKTFLESLELYRVDVHMYLCGHGWHCYTIEHGVANLGVSGINRPQQRCIVKTEQEDKRVSVHFCTIMERQVCLFPEQPGMETCPTAMAFLHLPEMAETHLALLFPWPPHKSTL